MIDWSKVRTATDAATAELEAARSAALAEALAWIEDTAARLIKGIPAVEVAAFGPKEAAATAFRAGTITPGQQALLASEAGLVGETVEALVANILANAAVYNPAIGVISGVRRKVHAGLATAGSAAECAAVVVAAIASAQTMMESDHG